MLIQTAAVLLRSKSFTGKIIIAADNDFIKAVRNGGKNAGMNTAEKIRAIDPARVYIIRPPFDRTAILRSSFRDSDSPPSDWNDFFLLYGDAARPAAAALRDMATAFLNQR